MRLGLAAGVVIAGCATAGASTPRFPDPLPPHTRFAYAQDYGGIVGGHSAVILTDNGTARVRCRFARDDDATLKRHPGRKRIANWKRLLQRAQLSKIKSDDPNRTPTESPQTWLLYNKRVTYLQWFSHREGLPPRVRDVSEAFERYLDRVC
ncbi:MAG: hypothetical protein QOJ29_1518 [Thermoleophilaceae bacterium]|nr:hypothetical protein [Thermoleophilaceae bacterium]